MHKLIRHRAGLSLSALALAALLSPSMPAVNQNGDVATRTYSAKCRALSFARRPPGQMATTMRNIEIERCIKNKGELY